MKIPKTAMVLCAGLGERMRPLTDHTPKPLLQIGGQAILTRILDHLHDAGVERVVVNVHHLADQIEDYLNCHTDPLSLEGEGGLRSKPGEGDIHLLRRSKPNSPSSGVSHHLLPQGRREHLQNLKIVISDERNERLETGGGVKKALPLIGSDLFFTLNGDAVWIDGQDRALIRMAQMFDPEKMDVLLLLCPVNKVIGSKNNGDCFCDDNGRVTWRGEKANAPYMFASVTITNPCIYKDAPEGAFSQKLLWDKAEKAGRLYGLIHDAEWLHVSQPEDLETVNNFLS